MIEYTSGALKDLESLDRGVRGRVMVGIARLADNPRGPGTRKLQGYDDLWRLRVGAYRVIYEIDDGKLIVTITQAVHRGNAYR